MTGESAAVSPAGDARAEPGSASKGMPQGAEIVESPPPDGADALAVSPLDGPLPPDADLIELPVTGTAAEIPGGGEELSIGSQQALFAEPGRAPDTVETRLDEDPALPPGLPPAPPAQQRLPAWIADLLND